MIRWISCWLGFMFFTLPLLAENQGQDAGALYLEGRKLAMGEGCQVEMIRARELYRKAADLGIPGPWHGKREISLREARLF